MIPKSSRTIPKQVAGTKPKPVNKNVDLKQLDEPKEPPVIKHPTPSTIGQTSRPRLNHRPKPRSDDGDRTTFVFPSQGTIKERLNWWVNHSHDTGISSQTIAYVCADLTWGEVGGPPFSPSPPLDADDFGRCVRLIERIPEWRDTLWKVGQKHPDFHGIIQRWDELKEMYDAKDYVECSKLIRSLR
tara:strand:- start:1363 stop:1920 length:558 start_codon:yes stop_codon:yes gene_type:complete